MAVDLCTFYSFYSFCFSVDFLIFWLLSVSMIFVFLYVCVCVLGGRCCVCCVLMVKGSIKV